MPFRRPGRCSGRADECKEKILLTVDGMPQLNKAAFYGDPTVASLVDELHQRWQRNGYQGEPIDYASEEELETLLEKAYYYSRLPAWKAYRLVYGEE